MRSARTVAGPSRGQSSANQSSKVARSAIKTTKSVAKRAIGRDVDETLDDQIDRAPKVVSPKVASNRATRPVHSGASKGTTAKRAPQVADAIPGPSRRPVNKTPADGEAKPKWSTDESLSVNDRARAAMTALNISAKALGAATQAAWKSGSSAKEKDGVVYDAQSVEWDVRICGMAVKLLRGFDEQGKLGEKGLEVEKAAQGVAARCISLGLDQEALGFLRESRISLLRRYDHATSKTDTGHTSTTARTTSLSKPGPSRLSTQHSGLSKERCIEMTKLPVQQTRGDLTEALKSVLFQALANAWALALGCGDLTDEDLRTACTTPETNTNGQLNPLTLAAHLPAATTSSYLSILHRRCMSYMTTDAKTWLHSRHLAFDIASLLITSSEPVSKITPPWLWEQLHKHLSAYMEKGRQRSSEDCAKEVSNIIEQSVDWVERLIGLRKEARDAWMTGAGWNALLDLWIVLAGRLKDQSGLDRALALLTAGTHISSPRKTSVHTPVRSSSPASTSQVPPPISGRSRSPLSAPKPSKGNEKVVDGETEVRRLCGLMTEVVLSADKYLDQKDELRAASLDSSLRSLDLSMLVEAFSALSDGETGTHMLDKGWRVVDKIRRRCVKIFETAKQTPDPQPESSLLLAVRQWLNQLVDFVDDLLRLPLDIECVAHEAIASAVDTLVTISQCPETLSSTPRTALAYLQRGHTLSMSRTQNAAPQEQAQWLRALCFRAHNLGCKLWKTDCARDALPFATLNVEWAEEAILLIPDSTKGESTWIEFRGFLNKRYALLADVQRKLGDHQASFTSTCHAVASQSSTDIEKLERAASTESLEIAFTNRKDLAQTLLRLAVPIQKDPTSFQSKMSNVLDIMSGHRVQPAVVGLLCEKLYDQMDPGIVVADLATVMLELGRCVLGVYEWTGFPIRHTRMAVRMLSLIMRAGSDASLFNELRTKIDGLTSVKDLGDDRCLAIYRQELIATTTLLDTLNSYSVYPDPTMPVLGFAKEAFKQLRELILPPTMAGSPLKVAKVSEAKATSIRRPLGNAMTVKAPTSSNIKAPPAKKNRATSDSLKKEVPKLAEESRAASLTIEDGTNPRSLDDGHRLAELLGSLVSLLGLLGHVLPKVESLKLLRAILRERPDLADDYVLRSVELATEYMRLGKHTRARTVFIQTSRLVDDGKHSISFEAKVDLHLRYGAFLAVKGESFQASEEYSKAEEMVKLVPIKSGDAIDRLKRLVWTATSRQTLAAIASAQGDAATSINHQGVAFRLLMRAADIACRVTVDCPVSNTNQSNQDGDDPFKQAELSGKGADEPSIDETTKTASPATNFQSKVLCGVQWRVAEELLNLTLDFADALARRGSASSAEYYLKLASEVALAVKTPVIVARVSIKQASLLCRLRDLDGAEKRLVSAAESLPLEDGPDVVELRRVQAELLACRDDALEAGMVLKSASKEVHLLDETFAVVETLIPSPKKSARLSTSSAAGKMSILSTKINESLLPAALAFVLRQQAWIMRGSGLIRESDQVLLQLRNLAMTMDIKAEGFYLDGKIGLLEAFSHFQTDLWTCSLTESTIAMPMGTPIKRVRDQQSTRDAIQHVLERSQAAFSSALEISARSGRVEDVRLACLSLALLRAFQTSLGQGSKSSTAAAAEILASAPSITLHRELLEAIDGKLIDGPQDDLVWLSVGSTPRKLSTGRPGAISDAASPLAKGGPAPLFPVTTTSRSPEDQQDGLRSFWKDLKVKYLSGNGLSMNSAGLEILPPEWAVISVNVTEDKNHMLISRHQRDTEPLVFTLPLDRVGKRENQEPEDMLSFEMAVNQLKEIVDESNGGARTAKDVGDSSEARRDWWKKRYELDERLKGLLDAMEFCWLGAFKTIFSQRLPVPPEALEKFRKRLSRVFDSALPRDAKNAAKRQMRLDTALLECFATLSSKCKDEEAEDLVFFILDLYQFHGFNVPLAELDIDEMQIHVREALAEVELARSRLPPQPEHLFLALDKNVAGFPWESMPILRGRSISRIPSLPFLLHQVAMTSYLSIQVSAQSASPTMPETHLAVSTASDASSVGITSPAPSRGRATASRTPSSLTSGSTRSPTSSKTSEKSTVSSASSPTPGKVKVDTRKVFYILNPSGDLSRTQTHFEPWLTTMAQKGGWKGIVGRRPTELELEGALKEYDLVLYFGHGGAEQYIRSHKVRHLETCATAMLWGCSSGHLREQGDFDRTGTAWNYMIAGCPSLVATLWDVTDRDIDRLSEGVFKKLQLDPAHVRSPNTPAPKSSATSSVDISIPFGELSTAEAVAKSRDECKLKYLTGAAPVVYGMPVWLR